MKKVDIWMPWHIMDYIKDTPGLSVVQDCAYRRALDQAWVARGKLPADPGELRNTLRLSPAEWAKSKSIFDRYFYREGNFYRNRRIDIELVKAAKRAEVARENGKTGGRPKAPEEPGGVPADNPAGYPDPNPEESSSSSSSSSQEGKENTCPSGAGSDTLPEGEGLAESGGLPLFPSAAPAGDGTQGTPTSDGTRLGKAAAERLRYAELILKFWTEKIGKTPAKDTLGKIQKLMTGKGARDRYDLILAVQNYFVHCEEEDERAGKPIFRYKGSNFFGQKAYFADHLPDAEQKVRMRPKIDALMESAPNG